MAPASSGADVRVVGLADDQPHAAHPDQYRALARQLGEALDAELPQDALKAVFKAFPAAAEIYENRHYAHSGLSHAPLERSIATEMLTSQLLRRVGAKDWKPAQG